MAHSAQPKPLQAALNGVRVGDVKVFQGSSRDIATDVLRQAHALTLIWKSALSDAADLNAREVDSDLETTREQIKADAMDGLGSLIGLAAALVAEG